MNEFFYQRSVASFFCTIVKPTFYTTDKAYLTQIFYLKMLFFKQAFQ